MKAYTAPSTPGIEGMHTAKNVKSVCRWEMRLGPNHRTIHHRSFPFSIFSASFFVFWQVSVSAQVGKRVGRGVGEGSGRARTDKVGGSTGEAAIKQVAQVCPSSRWHRCVAIKQVARVCPSSRWHRCVRVVYQKKRHSRWDRYVWGVYHDKIDTQKVYPVST